MPVFPMSCQSRRTKVGNNAWALLGSELPDHKPVMGRLFLQNFRGPCKMLPSDWFEGERNSLIPSFSRGFSVRLEPHVLKHFQRDYIDSNIGLSQVATVPAAALREELVH